MIVDGENSNFSNILITNLVSSFKNLKECEIKFSSLQGEFYNFEKRTKNIKLYLIS